MRKALQDELERLSQAKVLARLTREVRATEMVTVYLSELRDQQRRGIYCALIPSARIEESLGKTSWDLRHGRGLPEATQYRGKNGEQSVEYLRFGDPHIEPLVVDRGFYGIRPDYVELSEEFRFFHRLFHDPKEGRFLKIEDDGNETLVATIKPKFVEVRLKELRQFLAIKEMHLAIQFSSLEHSSHRLEELGLEVRADDHHEDSLCWQLSYGSCSGLVADNVSFSWLLGKRLIPPLPKEKSGLWGFAREERKKYEEFTVRVDENGDDVTYLCDPDALSDIFGGSLGAPHYLTTVHFRRSVLDKYYNQPAKYSVEDSILRCGTLWDLTIDNHHDDKVCAWLGDLGRDLPHTEQLHWRSHNIPPAGGVSKTFFCRQMLNQFTNTDRPELLFHEQYHSLEIACKRVLGWQILLPLSKGDIHYSKGLRTPSTDDQKDFDEVVLALTKILIDSLNEKKLNGFIAASKRSEIKGSIGRLAAVFTVCEVADYEQHIGFLRKLQRLRSSGVAHRKGSRYYEIAADFSTDSQNLRAVLDAILRRARSFLAFMTDVVNSGKLGDRNGPSLLPPDNSD